MLRTVCLLIVVLPSTAMASGAYSTGGASVMGWLATTEDRVDLNHRLNREVATSFRAESMSLDLQVGFQDDFDGALQSIAGTLEAGSMMFIYESNLLDATRRDTAEEIHGGYRRFFLGFLGAALKAKNADFDQMGVNMGLWYQAYNTVGWAFGDGGLEFDYDYTHHMIGFGAATRGAAGLADPDADVLATFVQLVDGDTFRFGMGLDGDFAINLALGIPSGDARDAAGEGASAALGFAMTFHAFPQLNAAIQLAPRVALAASLGLDVRLIAGVQFLGDTGPDSDSGTEENAPIMATWAGMGRVGILF